MSPTSEAPPVKEAVNVPSPLPPALPGRAGLPPDRPANPPLLPPRPARRKRPGVRIAVLALLGALPLVLTGSIRYWSWEASGADPAGQTTPSRDKEFCFGLVDYERGTLQLTPQQAGRVVKVLVKENDPVKAQAPILLLEDDQAKARVAQTAAAVESARVQLDEARKQDRRLQWRIAQQEAVVAAAAARVTAAQQAVSRKERLAGLDQVSAEEVAIALSQLEEMRASQRGEQARLEELRDQDPQADVRKAEADLKSARANQTLAKVALEECTLLAPSDGKVLRVYAKVGDVIGEQMKKPGVLFGIESRVVVRAEIDQEFAQGIKNGLVAEVQDDVNPDGVLTGWAENVSPWFLPRREVLDELLQTRETRTLECLIAFPTKPDLRLGQRMRVTIKRGETSEDWEKEQAGKNPK